MKDWNIVVTIFQKGYKRALRTLRAIGPTEPTPYYNVLTMRVEDPMMVLKAIEDLTADRPALYDAIARVAPAVSAFTFASTDEFKSRAIATIQDHLAALESQPFHVRLHRRGAGLGLHSPEVERLLDDAVLASTTAAGTPAQISFAEPSVVVAIDTIDDRAGIAVWTAEDRARHPLLRPD